MHIPVLLNEMITHLKPEAGRVYIDATFGGGGYTKAILNVPHTKVIAFDKDPDAIARGQELKAAYPDRLTLIHSSFDQIDTWGEKVDGIVFDFGVSSFQIDEGARGFSFKNDGPLDMRMTKTGISAKDVVNTFKQDDLADIIFNYGDEPFARKIARCIVEDRVQEPFETTHQLAALIRRIVKRKDDIDAATKTFQALRIFVNNELIEIRDALTCCLSMLKNDGILVGVTFHSLEDRLLKQFLNKDQFYKKTKAITPSVEELRLNPRSRSAKLRAGYFGGA
ncbi:MAG: Ribosomal RNA small subunit methyltransferase H [Holosporales bacterium]